MKLLIITLVILLVSLNLFSAESDRTETKESAAKVEACKSCHNKIINLKGRGKDTLISQTKAIKSDDKPHPPAGLKELSDEDIAAIAEILEK
jgi:cytochrome c553